MAALRVLKDMADEVVDDVTEKEETEKRACQKAGKK